MPTLIGWPEPLPASAASLAVICYSFSVAVPAFLAIALMYRDDYSRAGFRMLPSFDFEGKFTKAEILLFTVVLVLATLLPAMAGGAKFLLCMSRLARSFFITPASWRPLIRNFCRAAWYTLPSSTYL